MNIRRSGASQQLITQPAHAALAARIMRQWEPNHFPDSSRKSSILKAVEHHDIGWAEVDAILVVDETTQQFLDFNELPDALKRETSWRGIDRLRDDPYAAALVSQHRLHVYRRHSEQLDWIGFFAGVTAARDAYLRASGAGSLAQLLRDYAFVRAGDLASLAFCNNWTNTPDDGCGYSMRLDGTTLTIVPDPFAGRVIEISIEAREIPNQRFVSAEPREDDLRGGISGDAQRHRQRERDVKEVLRASPRCLLHTRMRSRPLPASLIQTFCSEWTRWQSCRRIRRPACWSVALRVRHDARSGDRSSLLHEGLRQHFRHQ